MTVQVYLRWDGMTDVDRKAQDYNHGRAADGIKCGQAGFLHDFNRPNYTSIMLGGHTFSYGHQEHPVASAELLNRLPDTIEQLQDFGDTYGYGDDNDGWFNEHYKGGWTHYHYMIIGFIAKVAQLEGEGLNPKVYVSW